MIVTDLDARASGDVWLVGLDNSRGNGSYALAAHYTGGAWTTYTGAAIGADANSFASVSALSPTDVWAGGSRLYHFDGAHWTQASIQGTRHLPHLGPGADPNSFPLDLQQIVMLSPTQGWAIPSLAAYFGYQATQEEALRYDHGVWQWTTLALRGAPTPLPWITRFAPSSPTQGWALGLQDVSANEDRMLLLYYDAGAWGVVREQS
jgi:hypothetical protein